jgi:type II secretion system protein N
VKKIISGIIYVLRNEKKKIFIYFLFTLLFMVVLFPFGDLSDFVTSQISKATNNQVFVQFRDPGFSFFPSLGVELKDVNVETNFLPPIKAGALTVAPSILGLITFKPGVKLNASKIMGGNLDLGLQQSGKSNQIVNIDSENLELGEILTLTNAKLPITGKVSMVASADIDGTFAEQPKAEMEVQINKFDLSSDSIATPLGPLNLPPLSLNRVNLKGELKDGRLTIEQLTAGQSSDEMTANVKGRLDVRVQQGMIVQTGAFDLEIRLTAKESFKQKAGLFLSFLNAYQKPGSEGTTVYAFRIKGQNFNSPPNMSAL